MSRESLDLQRSRKTYRSNGDMYMQAQLQSVFVPNPSDWQQRRPKLTLTKSPLWSYSAGLGAQAYPSPPMSDSPTSPRKSSQQPPTSSRHGSGTLAPATTSVPAVGITPRVQGGPPPITEPPQVYPSQQQALYVQQRQDLQPRPPGLALPGRAVYSEPFASSSQVSMAPGLGTQQFGVQVPQGLYAGPVSTPTASVPRIARTSRRTKAHVAKACQNCKKAHLSCDAARPCARCVASGKQATCVDVEHKKRGRPRLRDEREARQEQLGMATASEAGPSAPGTAIRGHHRSDSYQRQLRSQTKVQSQSMSQLQQPLMAGPGPSSAAPRPGEVTEGFYPARSEPATGPPAIIAFLNLDLQILRCNEAFALLFGGGNDLRGRLLSNYIDRQHEVAVQRLQNGLREERSLREPTFLPSIFPAQEQQVVQSIDFNDVDRITQGYNERRESWQFVLPDGRREQLVSRISLARTSIYFAVIIMHRVTQPSTQRTAFARPTSIELPAPVPTVTSSVSPRAFAFQQPGPPSPFAPSSPPSPFASFQTLGTTLPPSTGSITSSYAAGTPSRPETSYFGRSSQHPLPPELTPTSQPSTSRSRSTTMEARPSPRERQRPQSLQVYPRYPIGSAPTTPLGSQFERGPTLQAEASTTQTPERQEEVDSPEESARKRRRTGMDIKDVLEK